MRSLKTMGDVRFDDGKRNIFSLLGEESAAPTPVHKPRRRFRIASNSKLVQIWAGTGGYLANAG